MHVFVAWSGDQSRQFAEALRAWIVKLFPGVSCFISERIRKGTTWFPKLMQNLRKAGYAIICITPDTSDAQWVHFEAGAAAIATEVNSVDNDPSVCSLLFGMEKMDLTGPLTSFQNAEYSREEIHEIALSINDLLTTSRRGEAQMEEAFNKYWDDLDGAVQKVFQTKASKGRSADHDRTRQGVVSPDSTELKEPLRAAFEVLRFDPTRWKQVMLLAGGDCKASGTLRVDVEGDTECNHLKDFLDTIQAGSTAKGWALEPNGVVLIRLQTEKAEDGSISEQATYHFYLRDGKLHQLMVEIGYDMPGSARRPLIRRLSSNLQALRDDLKDKSTAHVKKL